MITPDFTIDDYSFIRVGEAELESKGLIGHHISSMNDFYKIGIPQIITQVFKIERYIENKRDSTDEDKEIEKYHILVKFTKASLSKPTMINYQTGKEQILFPKTALIEDKTYSASLRIDVKITATAFLKNGNQKVRESSISQFKICDVPVMVGTQLCNKHGLSRETLIELGEDPEDPNGYFIVKGVEWVINNVENILFNQFHVFRYIGGDKELFDCRFISKPGDSYQNSDQFLVRMSSDGQLTCVISRDKLNELEIPFYVVFRALGWITDEEIFNNIIWDYENEISGLLFNILYTAFSAKYANFKGSRDVRDQTGAIRLIVDEIKAVHFDYLHLNVLPENYHIAIKTILHYFDVNFLPHIGMSEGVRHRKLRYFSLAIRKVILVYLGILEPTDHDSYRTKRVHTSGITYAKTFKTHFNASIVGQIKRRIVKDFTSTSFSLIDLAATIKTSIYGDKLEKLMTQSITSGTKTELKIDANRKITNRLMSKLLERENQISDYALLRQISVDDSIGSKQAERAHKMRRVHMTSIGYICPIRSTISANVGLNKELAIFASITPALSSEAMKDILYNDTEMIRRLDDITYKDLTIMNNVFVNGDWIGATENSISLLKKYRDLRRHGQIPPLITIFWDSMADEVHFWLDVGRLMQPLVIVYNNKRDPEKFSEKDRNGKFLQCTAFTTEIMDGLYSGKYDIDFLVKNGLVEYISAEEKENCLVCDSFEVLKFAKHDELNEFTHMDFPQSQMGLTALTCVFGQHNNTSKNTYQTSQVQQACGTPTLNWTYRCDKNVFLQYHNEVSIVRTFSDNYVNPVGLNVILAIACYSSYNIEDSLIFSKGAIDRGFFNGCRFTFINTKLEQKEEFGNPDVTRTSGMKNGNYSKLNADGMLTIGTIIEKGDVVIGKFIHTSKSGNYIYADKSIIYNAKENAIVHNVILTYNADDERFCKVVFKKLRPIEIGDKFSNRSGQKGIAAMIMKDSDLPFTKDGLRPSIIFNTHGIPSRMTIGQLMETLVGNLCASKGVVFDGTFYKNVDMKAVCEELKERGLDHKGRFKMMSGITGVYMDAEIFIGVNYYQRLQKFVKDKFYSISHGPTDAITRQPLSGKAQDGGLKIGEMEKACLAAHGTMNLLYEKLFNHSDQFTLYICRNCGNYATAVNQNLNIYKCIICRDNADIVKVGSSWSSKLINHSMSAMNIGTRMTMQPYSYETYLDENEEFY